MQESLFYASITAFTGKTNIQNFEMGKSRGRLRDPVAEQPGDQMIKRFGEAGGTSAIHGF